MSPLMVGPAQRLVLAVACATGLAACLGLAFVLAQNPLRARLECARETGACVFERSDVGETVRLPFRVDDLGAARVVRVNGSHGGGRSSLYFTVGTQRWFFASAVGGSRLTPLAASINAFVADADASVLRIDDDGIAEARLAWIVLGGALVAIAAIFVAGWRKLSP